MLLTIALCVAGIAIIVRERKKARPSSQIQIMGLFLCFAAAVVGFILNQPPELSGLPNQTRIMQAISLHAGKATQEHVKGAKALFLIPADLPLEQLAIYQAAADSFCEGAGNLSKVIGMEPCQAHPQSRAIDIREFQKALKNHSQTQVIVSWVGVFENFDGATWEKLVGPESKIKLCLLQGPFVGFSDLPAGTRICAIREKVGSGKNAMQDPPDLSETPLAEVFSSHAEEISESALKKITETHYAMEEQK